MGKRETSRRNRRVLKFFQVNFGLDAPYRVLADGNFIHRSVLCQLPVAQEFEELLQTRAVRMCTCNAVVRELSMLARKFPDDQYSKARVLVRKMDRVDPKYEELLSQQAEAKDASEAHEAENSAEDSENNDAKKKTPTPLHLLTPAKAFMEVLTKLPTKYIVCTQDEQLRAEIRRSIPGIPLGYIHGNILVLEKPSDQTVRAWKKMEMEKQLLSSVEKKDLKKRKRPAAPNPLSMKKKVQKTPEKKSVEQSEPVRVKSAKSRPTRRGKRRPRQYLRDQRSANQVDMGASSSVVADSAMPVSAEA